MEAYDVPELKTPEEVAGYLALKHANGTNWLELFELHTLILTRIARDYVKTWGATTGQDDPALYRPLRDGAYYALNYLEDDDEWYHVEPV